MWKFQEQTQYNIKDGWWEGYKNFLKYTEGSEKLAITQNGDILKQINKRNYVCTRCVYMRANGLGAIKRK